MNSRCTKTLGWHSRSCDGSVFARLSIVILLLGANLYGQDSAVAPQPSRFRVGEKLSYNISFGKFSNAGYAETHVVSRGKLTGKDAVEIRAKVKTYEMVSAAFFQLDESRTVFAAPDTGLPLHVTTSSNDSAIPKENNINYLAQPTQNFDLLTLIFKARESNGIGTFPLYENDQLYTATFSPSGSSTVRTDAGTFYTTVSRVQSDYFAAIGINDLYIHFQIDESRVPVVIRFTTAKGEFKAVLASIALPEVEAPAPTVSPSPTPTPKPPVTPRPTPTPDAYVENRPLNTELGFALGELLEYRLSVAGRAMATLALNARERKLVQGEDSLLLTATITGVEPGNASFRLGDSAMVQADPETLAPKRTETRFTSAFPGSSELVSFDKRTGMITFGAQKTVDGPIGTHSILSLIYAMRSFNLKPSRDASNPVNDTRVAVFWDAKVHVFTLRPANAEEITINGEKVSAQLVTVNTGNPQLDALALKVWLGTESRIPLRFSFGVYQADLVAQSSNLSR